VNPAPNAQPTKPAPVQPNPPSAQPPPPGTEPPRDSNLPPGRATPILPSGREFNITNAPRPLFTNQAGPIGTNQFALLTNEFGQITNGFATDLGTNRLPFINPTNPGNLGLTQATAFAVTNNLARMSPEQAANVMQFQSSLAALQNAVANFANVPNVQQILQDNPPIRQQVLQLGTQIRALGRGPLQPSDQVVNRLSEDLVLVLLPQWQLTPDRQLVLSVLINQAVNAANMTPVQINATANDTLATLQGAGVPPPQARLIGRDLHSIMAEVQAQRTLGQ